MTNARHSAAARTLFNVDHGYAPDDTEGLGFLMAAVLKKALEDVGAELPERAAS